MRVLVIGSLAHDSGETATGKVDRALGGSATFFSVASSLFSRTEIVAVIGEDFGQDDLGRLRAKNIGLTGVEQVPGKTFRWGGRYSKYFEHRETLFTELNVFTDFDPVVPEALRKPDVLFLANIHPSLQLKVLDQVERPRLVAMDTMNFWISGERELLESVLQRVDLLMINDEEAFELSGIGNLVLAAQRILEMGPKALVIKRGEHGSWLFDGEGVTLIPAVPLAEVIDPTGAGDSFAGGFAGYLAAAQTTDRTAMTEALVAGTLCASFAVQGFSIDRLERVDRADLRTRHQQMLASCSTLDCSRL